MAAARRIVLVGATGLVGRGVVLHAPPRPLVALQRRAADSTSDVGTRVAAIERWPGIVRELAPDVFVSCLGTTLRRVGGSVEAFRSLDVDAVRECATAAREAGTRHVVAVTSVGASSRVSNVYLRAKGVLEDALAALGFARLDLVRPGLLLGPRRERRPLEALGQRLAPFVDPLLVGRLRRFRSIPAETVARAILALVDAGGTGHHVHEHDSLVALAARAPTREGRS